MKKLYYLSFGLLFFIISIFIVPSTFAQTSCDRECIEVCVCHDTLHNPVTVCGDYCTIIKQQEHGAHIVSGFDTLGKCLEPTMTPIPTVQPTNTPTPTQQPTQIPTNTPTPTQIIPTSTSCPTPTAKPACPCYFPCRISTCVPTSTPQPTQIPTNTPTPTQIIPTATSTPMPTATPTPTLKPICYNYYPCQVKACGSYANQYSNNSTAITVNNMNILNAIQKITMYNNTGNNVLRGNIGGSNITTGSISSSSIQTISGNSNATFITILQPDETTSCR